MLRAGISAIVIALGVAGCTPVIPEGRAACATEADCPGGWICRDDGRGLRCFSTPGPIDGGPIDAEPPRDGEGPRDAGPTDGGAVCITNADCDDLAYCTGIEVCAPGDPLALANGCVPGDAPCDDGFACT